MTRRAEIDPDVVLGAAHELGHAVVDLAMGIPVAAITVNTRTGAGLTHIDLELRGDSDPAVWRAALVACVAGWEAELRWAARHGGRVERARSTTDFTRFRRYRRHAGGLSEHDARAQARGILRRDWALVERLAPRLALDGHLDAAALGRPRRDRGRGR